MAIRMPSTSVVCTRALEIWLDFVGISIFSILILSGSDLATLMLATETQLRELYVNSSANQCDVLQ